jgi:hypothetical protein
MVTERLNLFAASSTPPVFCHQSATSRILLLNCLLFTIAAASFSTSCSAICALALFPFAGLDRSSQLLLFIVCSIPTIHRRPSFCALKTGRGTTASRRPCTIFRKGGSSRARSRIISVKREIMRIALPAFHHISDFLNIAFNLGSGC